MAKLVVKQSAKAHGPLVFLYGGSEFFSFFVLGVGWGGVGLVTSGPATEKYSCQTLDLSQTLCQSN